MSLNLPFGIKILNPHSSTNEWYGKYNSLAEAKSSIPLGVRDLGLTVGVLESGKIVEYWWESGISDDDLVIKSSEAEGLVFPFLLENDFVKFQIGGTLLSEQGFFELVAKTLEPSWDNIRLFFNPEEGFELSGYNSFIKLGFDGILLKNKEATLNLPNQSGTIARLEDLPIIPQENRIIQNQNGLQIDETYVGTGYRLIVKNEDIIYSISDVIFNINIGTLVTNTNLPSAGNTRIDVAYFTSNGTILILQGVESTSSPVEPTLPLDTIKALIILVSENGVVIPTEEIIFSENNEWTFSTTSSAGIDIDNTSQVSGTFSIKLNQTGGTNPVATLISPTNLNSNNFTALVFDVKLFQLRISNTAPILLRFLNGTTQVGISLAFASSSSNLFGFDRDTINRISRVVIPLSNFNIPANTTFNRIQIVRFGTGQSSVYFDNIRIVNDPFIQVPEVLATQNFVLDSIVSQIQQGTNVTITVNPITKRLTISSTGGVTSVGFADLTGTPSQNLALATALAEKLNVSTYNAFLATLGTLAFLNTIGTAQISNNAVTLQKIQNINAFSLPARLTGNGQLQEVAMSDSDLRAALGIPSNISVTGVGANTLTFTHNGTRIHGTFDTPITGALTQGTTLANAALNSKVKVIYSGIGNPFSNWSNAIPIGFQLLPPPFINVIYVEVYGGRFVYYNQSTD